MSVILSGLQGGEFPVERTGDPPLIEPHDKIDKEEYLLAMERSPIKDTEIMMLLENALTDKINDREVYMKGIDTSYKYEGYNTYTMEELDK